MNTSFAGVKTFRANTHGVATNNTKNQKTGEKQKLHVISQSKNQIAKLSTAFWPSSIYRRSYQRQQGKSPGPRHSLGNSLCTKHNLEREGRLVYIGDPQGSRAWFPA
ncbi:hypothetical protein TNCV_5064061 [Trichonephila clavipes]|nr:hypothetical protein TNCV_5064061 [Trichonephila clavipes]